MAESNIEQSFHFMKVNADKYAKAKAQRVYLEQFRKSKKAILIREAESKGFKTGQERESYAYSHKDYLELLEGLRAAVETEESLRWKLTACREKIDHHKQQNMMAMAEMKMR